MIKKCIQKPFLILVIVIIILILGVVSLRSVKSNLLPDMSVPYLMVVTTYPGASPEKVEEEVTRPIESEVSTISGVVDVLSRSAENYSLVVLEFNADTDMDSTYVKVDAALETVSGEFPDVVGSPNIIEMSMEMVATVYAAVSYEGYDIYNLSGFVEDTVIPYFERVDTVASVGQIGLVERTAEVRLDKKKIRDINADILAQTNKKLKEAQDELDDAKSKLSDSESTLEDQSSSLSDKASSTNSELAEVQLQLNTALATKIAYQSQLTSLQVQQKALQAELSAYEENQIEDAYKAMNDGFATLGESMGEYAEMAGLTIPESVEYALDHQEEFDAFIAWMDAMGYSEMVEAYDLESMQSLYDIVEVRIPQINTALANLDTEVAGVEAMVKEVESQVEGLEEKYTKAQEGALSAAEQFGSADAQLSSASDSIASAKEELETAQDTLDDSVDAAVNASNLDSLLDVNTLASLIYAQNFAMPAGYIDDKDDNQWMLKVGDEITSLEELENLVLAKVDGVGTICLKDVADITIVDNADESYARLNGEPTIVLMMFKGSTDSTTEAAEDCLEAMDELNTQYEGLNVVPIVNTGDYIKVFIRSILQSILVGAILAVVVLLLFMKDIRPTLIVAFSIPFSVLTALVLMYFSGISINIMSLSGLSLSIGMLVDNSVVVMENIYRLRHRDMDAPRAGYQGAKQVASAIISSTLTTICVFFPMVFTTGYVRQLMLPMALTITFSLVASLLIALTLVPTLGAVTLRRMKDKKYPLFDRFRNGYAAVLKFFLRFKFIPLVVAAGLLVLMVMRVASMGVSLLPNMYTDSIDATVEMPEDITDEEAFAYADEVGEILLANDRVETVAIMDSSSEMSFIGNFGSSTDFSQFTINIIPTEDVNMVSEVEELISELREATADLDCEVDVQSSALGEVDEFFGSGVEINISGDDYEELVSISEDVMDRISGIEGIQEMDNGQDTAETALHLVVDRNKAMKKGITVAQIYQRISEELNTSAEAAEMTLDDDNMTVEIVDERDELTTEKLLDLELEVDKTKIDGTTVTKTYKLSDFANVEETISMQTIRRDNSERYVQIVATLEDGYNTTLVTRQIEPLLSEVELPDGYEISIGGESEMNQDMIEQLGLLMALGAILIYLIMVAQFQSLLSPFIVIFTVPLAFTGGLIGLAIAREQLTLVALIGFLVLMGTIVNNGIVFVDYVNQLRLGGMEKRDALIATGKTRMRPILMTALTTVLAMVPLVLIQDVGNSMSKGMAVVIIGGMLYATLMTLFVVPVLYDLFFRREPKILDVGDDSIDDVPDDAQEFMEELEREKNKL